MSTGYFKIKLMAQYYLAHHNVQSTFFHIYIFSHQLAPPSPLFFSSISKHWTPSHALFAKDMSTEQINVTSKYSWMPGQRYQYSFISEWLIKQIARIFHWGLIISCLYNVQAYLVDAFNTQAFKNTIGCTFVKTFKSYKFSLANILLACFLSCFLSLLLFLSLPILFQV